MRQLDLAHNFKRYGFILIVLILLVVPISWLGYASFRSWQYLRNLESSAYDLHEILSYTAKTTQLPIFNNVDASSAKDLRSLTEIETAIKRARGDLQQFNTTALSLSHFRYVSFLPYYHQALAQQSNAQTIVAQSNDVLGQYQSLIIFLKIYFGMDEQFTNITSRINSVQNLNTLRTSTNELQTDQQTLSTNADTLSHLQTPYDFQDLTDQTIAFDQKAAIGLKLLASSFATSNDREQQNGISQIEQAVQEHDNTLANLLNSIYQNLYTLREVNELPQKTDSVLAAHTSGD